MFWPIQSYVQWVQANEARATGIERIARGFSLFLANPGSLLSMESIWTATKIHSLTNQWILSSAGRHVSQAECLTWVLQLFHEVEALCEIYLRQSRSHRAGWLWVAVVQVLKCLVRTMINRDQVGKAVTVTRDFLSALVTRKRRGGERAKPAPLTSLVVPRVVSSLSTVHQPASWSDLTSYVVDIYMGLRSLLMSLMAYRYFPQHRMLTKAVFVPSPAVTSSVANLKRSLVPEWTAWRMFAIADIAALFAAHLVRKYRVTTVMADVDTSLAEDGELSASLLEHQQSSVEHTEDDMRMTTLRFSIAMSIFRDPLFSVVLKQSVYNHLVNGRLNRWIPLIGPLIANQVQYMMAMQQHSFLYTLM